MSGIAGLFYRDGRPLHAAQLYAMLETIAHRGPDDSGVWSHDGVGLGNCLLWTTPESLGEKLPGQDQSGNLTIAADARIDNRDDLISALGIPKAASTQTDSELILQAYCKWGEDCPTKLIGDFSFAIWDEREKKLFCARDTQGLKTFYYYLNSTIFAFGSEIKALMALPEVPKSLNEERVGDFLVQLFEDRSATFYEHIFRLPAASTLTVTAERSQIRTYWQLNPEHEIRLRNENEYAEAFRSIFDEAVRCRLRSAFPVGSALSGGLDSSAIACTARDLIRASQQGGSKVHTFSVIFPGLPEQDLRVIDERTYMNRVLDTGGFEPHFIRGDELSPMRDFHRVHWHLDEPNLAPNLYLHWAMYESAQANGVRVFLDGFDGDTTVSHGFEYLEELARGFRWMQLRREAGLLSRNVFENSTAHSVVWRYCLRDMTPVWMHRAWRLLHGRIREVRENPTLAHPDFTQRINLRARAHAQMARSRFRSARESHMGVLSLPLYAHALEVADKAASAFHVEARYPFFDRRLIEFCLSLPANQKLGQGWNRYVFRKAMTGVLPKEIQWRSGKGNLSSNFHRKLLQFEGDTLQKIALGQSEKVAGYIDTTAVERALREYKEAPVSGKNSLELFAVVNLALWLEDAKFEPAIASQVGSASVESVL